MQIKSQTNLKLPFGDITDGRNLKRNLIILLEINFLELKICSMLPLICD
jgi:hypothetical protein